MATSGSAPLKEYAFEMAISNIRYGPGVTQEVGMDVQNLGIKKLGVFTDKNVSIISVSRDVELHTVLCIGSPAATDENGP